LIQLHKVTSIEQLLFNQISFEESAISHLPQPRHFEWTGHAQPGFVVAHNSSPHLVGGILVVGLPLWTHEPLSRFLDTPYCLFRLIDLPSIVQIQTI
jgi:hypothetical protein